MDTVDTISKRLEAFASKGLIVEHKKQNSSGGYTKFIIKTKLGDSIVIENGYDEVFRVIFKDVYSYREFVYNDSDRGRVIESVLDIAKSFAKGSYEEYSYSRANKELTRELIIFGDNSSMLSVL